MKDRQGVLVVALFAIMLLGSGSARATNYYVASNGNDSNSGTSSNKPWRTLQKLNNTTFAPGDNIFLKRNSVWQGVFQPCDQTLCSGTQSAPIRIDAYGNGAKPIINGAGTAEATIFLRNRSYWQIRNLEITNDFSGPHTGFDYSGIQVVCDSGDPAKRVCRGIYIGFNTVRRVRGKLTPWFDRYGRNAGIAILSNVHAVTSGGQNNSNYFDGVTIENNTVSMVDHIGIFMGSWINGQTDPTCPDGINFDCVTQPSKPRSRNVLVRNNSVDQSGGDGIVVSLTDGALLQFNVVSNCGQSVLDPSGPTGPSAGLWSAGALNTFIEYNEVYNEKPGRGLGQYQRTYSV